MANTNSTTSYLDPPQLIGRPNADGTISITPLELKRLNDYNYYVAKMLQGGLNLANLNKEVNTEFSNIKGDVTELSITAEGIATSVSNLSGDVSTLEQTASGLTTSVSNLSGAVSTVSQTVDGLGVTTSGETTYITGDHVKTGTLTGVNLESTGNVSKIFVNEGAIEINDTTPEPYTTQYAVIGYSGYDGKLHIETAWIPLKIVSGSNMSIDSSGTIYIGSSAGYTGNVTIGQAGGAVNLVGNVYINGVLQ